MKFTYHFIFLSALSFMATPAFSAGDNTTITITGYISDNTCAVAADSVDIPVDLQTANAKDFFRTGITGPAQAFAINLSPCGQEVIGVKVMFSGVADDIDTQLLKLDSGTDSAAGLGIQLLDSQQQPLNLNEDFDTLSVVSLTPGKANKLTYYARLKSTQTPVTAGKVSATATFTLEYQ